MISIVLHRPGPQLSHYRPSFLLPSLIPNFDFHDILPGFGWGGILPGFGWGSFLPGFIKPPFLRPPKPGVFPGSGEEDENGEKKPGFKPTVVFNDTLKNEACLKTINETEGRRYVLLKHEIGSSLIRHNETDETYMEYVILKKKPLKSLRIPYVPPKEKRICVQFIGHASNMSYTCSIIECFWYEEGATTPTAKPSVKPPVKPSGGYLVISKMSQQIVEQISKFVKF
uniref:Uncharacterized protein n=1 Tax=Strongyloides papillosus TaxID=174720 RepID=A0A0N5B5M5_STREA